jgi:hypothetical protein
MTAGDRQPCAEHMIIGCPDCATAAYDPAAARRPGSGYIDRIGADPVYDYAIETARAQAEADDKLSNLRKDVDDGSITLRQFCDERILVLSEHLARLIRLRTEYLGE